MLEVHRLPGVDGGQQDSERVLGTPQAHRTGSGGDGNAGRGVDVHAGRPQLQQRTLRGGDPLGRLP